MGTNHGRVICLSIDDFKVEKTLQGEYPVTDLSDNKNMIISVY